CAGQQERFSIRIVCQCVRCSVLTEQRTHWQAGRVGTDRELEAIALLTRALAEVGLEPAEETADARADLVVRGRDGVAFAVEVKQRALVRDGDVPALTRRLTGADRRRGVVSVIVADRITEEAKNRL